MYFLVMLLVIQVGEPTDPSGGYTQYNSFTKYDKYFSKYSKRYFGVGFDWRYFKAQAIAESNLQPTAESPVGARGIMQIMPPTFADIKRLHPEIKGTIDEPRWNIASGIWYDRQNFTIWRADRTPTDRLKFMFGSYNAGRGNILRAQRAAIRGGLTGTSWSSIAQHLSEVTGRRSRETVSYVTRIFNIKDILN